MLLILLYSDFGIFVPMREFEKQVHYNTSGWLDKNKDPINECVVTLMQESKEPLVSSFFKEPEEGAIFYLSEF